MATPGKPRAEALASSLLWQMEELARKDPEAARRIADQLEEIVGALETVASSAKRGEDCHVHVDVDAQAARVVGSALKGARAWSRTPMRVAAPRRGPRRRGAGHRGRRSSPRATRAGPDDDPPDEPDQLGGFSSTATPRRNQAGGVP